VPSPMPVRNSRRAPLIGAPWVPQSQTVAGAWRARRLNTTVSLTVAPRARERAGVGGLTQPSVWRFPHSLHQAGRSPEGEVSVNHTAHNDCNTSELLSIVLCVLWCTWPEQEVVPSEVCATGMSAHDLPTHAAAAKLPSVPHVVLPSASPLWLA
jgi:hypothetical protein